MNGILFKPQMIKAIVSGNKTQTRRIMKPQPLFVSKNSEEYWKANLSLIPDDVYVWQPHKREFWYAWKSNGFQFDLCISNVARYKVGEILYIKEAWQAVKNRQGEWEAAMYKSNISELDLKDESCDWDWKSPMFMPSAIARYFIQITDVKVERLQDITEEDCIKEGIEDMGMRMGRLNDRYGDTLKLYASLWNSINKKYPWESNPWIFKYTFTKVDKQDASK